MGIGVSKQAAAAAANNNHHQLDHDSNNTALKKPVISPATTINGGRNSSASFISTGFGTGGFDNNQLLHHHHVRQPSVRRRQPMPPDRQELDQRFAKVLASMDLPPDKAKLLKNYDDERKWDIICDREMVHVKDPPSHYLTKLRTYLDPKASRSHRKRKMVGESTSTQVLRDLEISLRTNHIEWVKEFLDDQNQGLDALIDYLSFRLSMMRHEQRIQEARRKEMEEENNSLMANNGNTTTSSSMTTNNSTNNATAKSPTSENDQSLTEGHSNRDLSFNTSSRRRDEQNFIRPGLSNLLDSSPNLKRRSRHIAKLNMGASTDDIHVCIKCLRAIMNNKYGFNMVIQHREAINCIALSLMHKSLTTKALALELLAAICLVKGGHEIILSAFDNFKEVMQETKRFHILMEYFMNFELFNIDFMVACMQFVNIVVHSVEDMNFRVHLQYEFTSLGLDTYLEKLRLTESEELHVQISAYLDNVFDVAALMEDSETKTAALERVQELEEHLGRTLDRAQEVERDLLFKVNELESELHRVCSERDEIQVKAKQTDEEVSTLRKVLKQHEQESKKLEHTVNELRLSQINGVRDPGSATTSPVSNGPTIPVAAATAPPPPPPPPPLPSMSQMAPPAPPPPPAPPGMRMNGKSFVPPPPPPIAGHMPAPDGAMTIKRKVQTKYKLPTLNWIALKPNQVRGTIFNDLDDERLHKQIDFSDFEERFKIGQIQLSNGNSSEIDGLMSFPSKRIKKPEHVSLLEHTRLRNIAISRRKLEMPAAQVITAVNSLDLKQLSLENVELLQKMVPTEVEVKAYKEYVIEKKDLNLLTEEDKFILQLTKVERLQSKLSIMNYMGNFVDSLHLISPQIYSIYNGAKSVKNSTKLRAVLEVILAFGNYLNSSKRGPAYGFKLQSLDTLLDTKSTDKRICLLHYIVATVRQKFPDLLNFDNELFCIDKAAQVSLENVMTDVQELEKGMEVVRKEVELRGGSSVQNHVLKDFLVNSEDKLKKVRVDAKNGQEAFKDCVEFFGESSRNADANAFFALLVRFVKAFKTADQENEQRKRLEQAAALAALKKEENGVVMRNNGNPKKQQDAVINELKSKTNAVREKKLLQQDEVYNGALEDILLGLKSEPYRRADAVRRSQRRRIDSHRLSRTMDELDV